MKLYEIYTDRDELVQLTTNNEHLAILSEHPDWIAREVDIVEALVKYGNRAIQASKDIRNINKCFIRRGN